MNKLVPDLGPPTCSASNLQAAERARGFFNSAALSSRQANDQRMKEARSKQPRKKISVLGRLLSILGLLWAVSASAQLSVQFDFANCTTLPVPVRALTLYPFYVNSINPGGITQPDYIQRYTGTNGSVTISNILPGTYYAVFSGINSQNTNWFTFPATNGLIIAEATNANGTPAYMLNSTIFLGSTVPAWSQVQSDMRYFRLNGPSNTAILQQAGGGNSNTLTNLTIVSTSSSVPVLIGTNIIENPFTVVRGTGFFSNGANADFILVPGSNPSSFHSSSNPNYWLVHGDDANSDGLFWVITNSTLAGEGALVSGNQVNSINAGAWVDGQTLSSPDGTTVYVNINSNYTLFSAAYPVDNFTYISVTNSPFPVPGVPTFSAPISILPTNILARILPGVYPQAFFPNGTYLGYGRTLTILTNAVFPSGNTTLKDLSCGAINVGQNGPPAPVYFGAATTNLTLENVTAIGIQDGVLLTTNCVGTNTFRNCYFSSPWDSFISSMPTNSPNTNATFNFYECDLVSDDSLPGIKNTMHAFGDGPGIYTFYGGQIKAKSNRNIPANAIYVDQAGLTHVNYSVDGICTFIGTTISATNSNSAGSAYAIYNNGGAKLTFVNCNISGGIFDPNNACTFLNCHINDTGGWGGTYWPSNALYNTASTAMGIITNNMTNGGFWMGWMTNTLQGVWMSNNVVLSKRLLP